MDDYDFEGQFSILNGNLRGMATLELRKMATYVGMNEHTTETIDRLDEEQYGSLQLSLVTVANEEAEDLVKGKFALRLLMNIGQRSERHKGSLSPSTLSPLSLLLIDSKHVLEVAAVLTMAAEKLTTTAGLDVKFDGIIAAVAHLWLSVEDDETRCWLSAFISKMLEVDAAFLANSFGDMPCNVFTKLLHITDALCDGMVLKGRHEGEFSMHPNNVQMLIDIVQRAQYDYSDEAFEGPSSARYLSEYPNQLPLLLGIIASLATRHDLFGDVFERASNARLVEIIVEMLEVALHTEGDLLRAEEDKEKEENRPADRPPKAPEFESPRVLSSGGLSRMVAALASDDNRERAKERIGAMKCAAVRAIGNLSAECASNRIRAGASGAVVLCLAAARRREHDIAFVTQWSISSLRYLCLGCPENQELLAAIDSAPTGIIDRDGLLAQMGMRVVTVEEGEEGPGSKKRAKLMPL